MIEVDSAKDAARFSIIVARTIENEGGEKVYENAETGEYSKYGISLKFLQSISQGRTKADIDALTYIQSTFLYHRYFWVQPAIYLLADDGLASKVFDVHVNTGRGVKLLQLAANVTIDGLLGPATASAVNGKDPVEILRRFRMLAREHYLDIAKEDPRHNNDLKGWLDRLAKP